MLQTVQESVPAEDLGLILPHEHLFTDLRGPLAEGYAKADPGALVRVMMLYLEEAESAGVTGLVECSTVGVGRYFDVLQQLERIAPTGVCREALLPGDFKERSIEALAKLWVRELTEGIEGTDTRAVFIRLAMSDEGSISVEFRKLKAASKASRETGAVIATHSVNWDVVCGRWMSLRLWDWIFPI